MRVLNKPRATAESLARSLNNNKLASFASPPDTTAEEIADDLGGFDDPTTTTPEQIALVLSGTSTSLFHEMAR